jgi:hypothetical protein
MITPNKSKSGTVCPIVRTKGFNYARKECVMNLPLIKHHMEALYKLLIQEPNSTVFGRLAVDLEALLNSLPLKNIKEGDGSNRSNSG